MLVQILILLAGLALVVFGADFLVDGSSSIARKAGVSEFLIGLTIVGIGTSLPELVVSLNGALAGKADIAIGNIMGSNMFNVFLILGLTAILRPVAITRDNLLKDIPMNIAASILLVVMGLSMSIFSIGKEDSISTAEGFIFLAIFASYIAFSFRAGKEEGCDEEDAKDAGSVWMALLKVISGIVALIAGGRLFVDSASQIASMAGLSDKFIAVTILSGGTSLPELVTCIVAALKKKDQIALGNIIGSNISNIFLIVGSSAVFFRSQPDGPHGLSFSGMSFIDIGFFLLSSILLWACSYSFPGKDGSKRLDKADGAILVAMEAAYLITLIATA